MNAAFAAALAREKKNRLQAYFPCAQSLIGCPVVALTWRHLIELSWADNAFFSAEEPTGRDVEVLLWRLNPCFRRADGEFPNLSLAALARGQGRPGRLRVFFERLAVHRIARGCSPNLIEKEIRTRINEAFQDIPAGKKETEEFISPLRAIPTWYDYVSNEFAERGHSREQILDYSVAWTFQMLRIQGINAGKEDRYIPPSAALIGPAPSAP